MKSKVVIARVPTYDPDAVLAGVRECLEPLGSMSAFVQPGQRVLLKPNLLAAFPPERAVSTHPTVVRAVGKLVQEQGGKLIIGDSPGIGEMPSVMRRAGIAAVLIELGAELGDFKHTAEFESIHNIVGRHISLARAVADADVIITLPKLKTHAQMGFTGAIKNQYGLVVGSEKAHYHFRLKTREWLARLMIDINRVAKPALAVMDAIVGMEGPGPAGGDPRTLGALIASTDLPALDTIACSLIGLSPADYPLLQAAKYCGYGTWSLDEIDQVGVPWRELAQPDWKKVPELMSTLRLLGIPESIQKWLGERWSLRPRIIAKRCIKCMACQRGCPVNPPAIHPETPDHSVDDDRCIRCYCCHEFCPEKAIELKRRWFG